MAGSESPSVFGQGGGGGGHERGFPLVPSPTTMLVDDQTSTATWELWDAIRSICEYHPRLSLSAFSISV